LLSDDFDSLEQIDNNQDLVFPGLAPFPAHPPILHRLQHQAPFPLTILKSHVLGHQVANSGSNLPSGGGISPTLTWSGGTSPMDHDISPGLHDGDYVDVGGEVDLYPPLFSASTQSSPRRRSFGSNSSGKGRRMSRGRSSRDSSHSRSISSHSGSAADDDLAMSTLSLISSTSTHVDFSNGSMNHLSKDDQGTTSLALISQPPSPVQHRDNPSAHTRKKSRTLSHTSFDGSNADYADLAQAGGNTTSAASNRLIPTGHRRNITSASLVPLDAPTQIRNYLTPSSTSKKDTPSAFVARKNKLKAKAASLRSSATPTAPSGRKRSLDDAGFAESIDSNDIFNAVNDYADSKRSAQDDGGDTMDTNAEIASESNSLLSAIEAKRRQNTLAARRSRQRKLDYVRNLEELLGVMTRERDHWKDRAEQAEAQLGIMDAEEDDD